MSKKPLYKFVFSSVESAESFYDFAVKHSNSHLVNYSGNPDGKIDHTRVEVIGTGSNVFDIAGAFVITGRYDVGEPFDGGIEGFGGKHDADA